jgi:hypothetical protein
VLFGEKIEIFNLCFDTFLTGVKHFHSVDLTVILDNCPNDFKDSIIEKSNVYKNLVLTFEDNFISGNQGTFKKQLEVLSSKQAFDFFLFLEDDYFFISNWFEFFNNQVNDISQVDYFLTGFRTSDYDEMLFHKLFKGKRFANSELSTTLTFFCTPKALVECRKAFDTFVSGNFDNVLWLMITDTFYLSRLILLTLLSLNRRSFSRLYKGIRYFKWCQKYTLFVSSESYMLHLDERGFPEEMRAVVQI